MKRIVCLLLAFAVVFAFGAQAFADDALFCRMCGKQIPSDSRFCSYCGAEVVTHDHASQSAAPAAVPVIPAATPAPTPPVVIAQPAAADSAKPATVQGPFYTTMTAGSTLPAYTANVRVTKSPTSESVPYGGACMFIAHAANATSITWYIANSDASLIIPAAEAPAYVSGLSVSGVNNDTLYLSGIPAMMNGCQVQACFTGEGGPVYTEVAKIWTYQPSYSCSKPKDDSIWTILAEWDPWWDCYWWDWPYWCDPVPPGPYGGAPNAVAVHTSHTVNLPEPEIVYGGTPGTPGPGPGSGTTPVPGAPGSGTTPVPSVKPGPPSSWIDLPTP